MSITWFYSLFVLLGINLFVGIIFYFVNSKKEFDAKEFGIILLQSIILIPIGIIYYYKTIEYKKLANALEGQLQQALTMLEYEKNKIGSKEFKDVKPNA